MRFLQIFLPAHNSNLIYADLKARTACEYLTHHNMILLNAFSPQRFKQCRFFFKPFVFYLQLTDLPIQFINQLLILLVYLFLFPLENFSYIPTYARLRQFVNCVLCTSYFDDNSAIVFSSLIASNATLALNSALKLFLIFRTSFLTL